jgi:hypothetical protein
MSVLTAPSYFKISDKNGFFSTTTLGIVYKINKFAGNRGVWKLVSVRHASLLLPALSIVEKMAANIRQKRRN